MVGLIVEGAAKAFGWIPWLGPKLKSAASAFSSWRNSVMSDLDSLDGRTVTITLDIQRIDSSGAGNAKKNAQHSGGYQIPATAGSSSSSTTSTSTSTPDLNYDPTLFTSPSTTAATSAASAAANKKKQAAAQKLADNDSLLKSVKAIKSAGKQLTAALLAGLKAGNGGLQAYLDKIKSDIGSKLASGDISKAAAKSMRNTVAAISKQLKGVETAYDAAMTQIKTLQDAKAQVVSSVSSSLSGELDLSQGISSANQFGYGGGTATFDSVSSVITGLKTRLQTFLGLIGQLRDRGVPGGLLQEVAALGSTNGITVAQALLSGTQSQLSSLSDSFNSIFATNLTDPTKGGLAQQIGALVGGAMYDTGIQAQQGLLKGLLDDKGITAAGSSLAKKLTKAIRKALQIHSPSRLMAKQVGIPAGQGIGVGTLAAVDGWVPDVAARMSNIQPAAASYSGYGSGATAMHQSDIERLADAIASRPNILRMGERDAAKVVLAGSNSPLVTSLRPGAR